MKIYRSEALASVHEMMKGLADAGHVGKRTMRRFDETCLPKPLLSIPATHSLPSSAEPTVEYNVSCEPHT